MIDYRDIWYLSTDGLELYARDYAHPAPKGTVLCLHGLTRNSADFAALCETLNADYRLVVPDQRGRGRSAYDPDPQHYNPGTYVADMFTLLDHLGIDKVTAIGTSMGGVMTMLIAAARPGWLRTAILNDIGPELDPRGLARIQEYVGTAAPVRSWEEAAARSRDIHGVAFPDYGDDDWMAFARRVYREGNGGAPELAVDPAIGQQLNANTGSAVPPDLWLAFDALRSTPTLIVRGALSDLLSSDCVEAMRARKPDLVVVEVENRGHAPMLDEPTALAAIRAFLADF